MTVATFDPVAFKARYPAFAAVDNALLTACFADAGLYLCNGDNSPVQDIAKRTSLLWMLTAHIAYLGGALSPDGLPPMVGRTSSASEGSVSVSSEFAVPGTAAWFSQTQWGAAFWQATTYLRSFNYRARPTQVEGQNGYRIWWR